MITPFNATTSATSISTAKTRTGLMIQNHSDTDMYVSLDGSSDVTVAGGAKPGIKVLASGGTLVMCGISTNGFTAANAIYVIHGGSGNKAGTIHEW